KGGRQTQVHPGNREFASGDRIARPEGGGGGLLQTSRPPRVVHLDHQPFSSVFRTAPRQCPGRLPRGWCFDGEVDDLPLSTREGATD
ncbi:MAG TPA: DUF444 family protein, partial [Candidatus Latescibacteria bacterium]|nr:DUF444 family protein [Candidatus Latescibacterota bacterium]